MSKLKHLLMAVFVTIIIVLVIIALPLVMPLLAIFTLLTFIYILLRLDEEEQDKHDD